ncbi:hypothetical protein [Erwinia sp. 198]|uniref:hypothetical protein n=1 Tax=Erwinia sp. 198 TaxID=2022746 RepID=UPI000F6667E9|nr:hypothetical protein [Erwinia sp. 198]
MVCGHDESASRKEFTLTAERLARPHVPHVGVSNQSDQDAGKVPADDRSALRIYELFVGEAPVAAQPELAQQLDAGLGKLLQDYRSGAIALWCCQACSERHLCPHQSGGRRRRPLCLKRQDGSR